MSDWQGDAKPAPPTKGELRTATMQLRGKTARDKIWGLFIVGLIATAIGAILAVSENPTTTTNVFGGTDKSGSDGGYAIGLALGALGYTMILVAVIAWGVALGNRASSD